MRATSTRAGDGGGGEAISFSRSSSMGDSGPGRPPLGPRGGLKAFPEARSAVSTQMPPNLRPLEDLRRRTTTL